MPENVFTKPEKCPGLNEAEILALKTSLAAEGTPEDKLKAFTRAVQGIEQKRAAGERAAPSAPALSAK